MISLYTTPSIKQVVQIIDFIDNYPFPAGIIANKNDLVIRRNPASFEAKDRLIRQYNIYLPNRTTELQPAEQLNQLKRSIRKLKPIKQLPSNHYIEKEYYLNFDGNPIKVADRFYHLRHNGESLRIWTQLKEAEIG